MIISTSTGDEYDELTETVSLFLAGKLGPEAVISLLELMPGLPGLVQLAALSIPRGRVATYLQLARVIGTSPRAVGRFISMNELPVVVPCHRVIRSNGSLGGYSMGINVKRILLEMEGIKADKIGEEYLVREEKLRETFLALTSKAIIDKASTVTHR